jgi:hypothetical protein
MSLPRTEDSANAAVDGREYCPKRTEYQGGMTERIDPGAVRMHLADEQRAAIRRGRAPSDRR